MTRRNSTTASASNAADDSTTPVQPAPRTCSVCGLGEADGVVFYSGATTVNVSSCRKSPANPNGGGCYMLKYNAKRAEKKASADAAALAAIETPVPARARRARTASAPVVEPATA